MLQHLQLIKPKKVYKIDSYLEKLQKKKQKNTIQQKHKESVLPTKRCFAFIFVSALPLYF